MVREGILLVISAPSGAGKTTLSKQIVDMFPELGHSVSYTTRAPRAGEVDGVDYHFTGRDDFLRMVEAGEFAEWAEVHGNLYGTSISVLEEARRAGRDIILDIDWQGAAQLKKNYRGGVFIFIMPPDIAELERRLLSRNLDSAETVALRLANARTEIRESRWYDYIIVNDILEKATDEFRAVIVAERCRASRMIGAVAGKFGLGDD